MFLQNISFQPDAFILHQKALRKSVRMESWRYKALRWALTAVLMMNCIAKETLESYNSPDKTKFPVTFDPV
jgi:hypothetical protein